MGSIGSLKISSWSQPLSRSRILHFGQLPVLMIPSVQFQVLALTFSLTTLLRSKEPNNDWIFGGQHVQKTAENLTPMKFVLLEA